MVFQQLIGRANNGDNGVSAGDTNIHHDPLPVVLASTRVTVVSDANGLASFQPNHAGVLGAVIIQGTASSGIASLPFLAQSFGR